MPEILQFPQLNDSNYAEWALRMEAILVLKSLWSVVHVEVPDADTKDDETVKKEFERLLNARTASKMAEARAEMILQVDGGQLSHMLDKDPREIWLTLQRVHRAGFATNLVLKRKLLTMKKQEEQTMQAWIGKIKAHAFHMNEAGIEVSELDTILALTMGLPSTYDAVIINFDATPNEQLTVDYVVGQLLNEETRQADLLWLRAEGKKRQTFGARLRASSVRRLDISSLRSEI